MSVERILVDTSVWIEYFKNKSSSVAGKLEEILTDSEIYIPKIVLAELIQGAKSKKELAVIDDLRETLFIVDQKKDSWEKAGRLSHTLRKKGKNIHLLDCYIAVIAQEYGCTIFTLNRHFKDIQTILDISIIDK